MALNYPPILDPAMQRIARLEAEISRLKAQLEEVCAMLGINVDTDPNPDPIPIPIPIPNPPNPVPKPAPVVTSILYCSYPVREGEDTYFPVENLSANEMDRAYRIEPDGKQAKFYLMSGETAFNMLTEDTNSYIDPLADAEYGEEFMDIETLEPGKVVLHDKGWKVIEKAKVRII